MALSDKFHSGTSSLVRLRRGKSLNQCRVPHIHHLLVSSRVGMDSVAQVAAKEACILVHDPDGRFRLVQAGRPRWDLRVQLLDLGVVAADGEGDDLRDLY